MPPSSAHNAPALSSIRTQVPIPQDNAAKAKVDDAVMHTVARLAVLARENVVPFRENADDDLPPPSNQDILDVFAMLGIDPANRRRHVPASPASDTRKSAPKPQTTPEVEILIEKTPGETPGTPVVVDLDDLCEEEGKQISSVKGTATPKKGRKTATKGNDTASGDEPERCRGCATVLIPAGEPIPEGCKRRYAAQTCRTCARHTRDAAKSAKAAASIGDIEALAKAAKAPRPVKTKSTPAAPRVGKSPRIPGKVDAAPCAETSPRKATSRKKDTVSL